jgi:DNA-binding YbaB/EbfC family protein
MGTGFSKRKKQAKMMQEQLSQLQHKLSHTEVTGTAGNGLVTITLGGDNEMKQIKIKPECVDPEDIEGLETLIKAAYKDAANKLKSETPSTMPGLPPGFPSLGDLGI